MTPGNGNGRPVTRHQERRPFALRQLEDPKTRVEYVKVEPETAKLPPGPDGTPRYRRTGRSVMTIIYRGSA